MSCSITESGLGLGLVLGPSRASTPKTHQHLHRRLLLRQIVGGGGGNVGPAGSSEAPEPLRLECRRQPREERNRTVLLLLLLFPPLLCSTILIINAACRPLEGTRRQVSPLLGDDRCLPSLQRPD